MSTKRQQGAVVELKVGESVSLDQGRIRITLEPKSGQRARLRIVADENVQIGHREPRALTTQIPVRT